MRHIATVTSKRGDERYSVELFDTWKEFRETHGKALPYFDKKSFEKDYELLICFAIKFGKKIPIGGKGMRKTKNEFGGLYVLKKHRQKRIGTLLTTLAMAVIWERNFRKNTIHLGAIGYDDLRIVLPLGFEPIDIAPYAKNTSMILCEVTKREEIEYYEKSDSMLVNIPDQWIRLWPKKVEELESDEDKRKYSFEKVEIAIRTETVNRTRAEMLATRQYEQKKGQFSRKLLDEYFDVKYLDSEVDQILKD